ncbi:MAG: methyltransferase domain-containing protein [Parcubacteria group bacterium]|nr:methyltransferase domain-containing protein [Parcubacteria group bacterium]
MPFSNPQTIIESCHFGMGWHVAEFGVGSGAYTRAILKVIGKEGFVYAVDIQKNLLNRVLREANDAGYSNISIVHGDLEQSSGSKLGTESMDAVVIANLLFQTKNKNGVVAEARRVLKPKGKVLVVDWSASFAGIGPREEDVISGAETEKLFTAAGFVAEKTVNAGEHHYGILFKKG